jgi:hypothetical protein
LRRFLQTAANRQLPDFSRWQVAVGKYGVVIRSRSQTKRFATTPGLTRLINALIPNNAKEFIVTSWCRRFPAEPAICAGQLIKAAGHF